MVLRTLSSKKLTGIYQELYIKIGPRDWWPADSPFEIIVGAILTQNTSWTNVKKAIANLKQQNLLSPQLLSKISEPELAGIIRPSGYYNQKAKKIKNFLKYFMREYSGSIEIMATRDMYILRTELLAINGIGPETADSILLYALEKPIFVVDSYTRRIFSRHNWLSENLDYQEMQDYFMNRLNENVILFNEFHALIDYIGHHYCRKKPLCDICPLKNELPQNLVKI